MFLPSRAYLPLRSFLGEVSVKVSGTLLKQGVFLLLRVKRCWHVLDNRLLSETSFANIPSPSVAYLILLTLPFAEQKFLIFRTCISSVLSHGSCLWYYIEEVAAKHGAVGISAVVSAGSSAVLS